MELLLRLARTGLSWVGSYTGPAGEGFVAAYLVRRTAPAVAKYEHVCGESQATDLERRT